MLTITNNEDEYIAEGTSAIVELETALDKVAAARLMPSMARVDFLFEHC